MSKVIRVLAAVLGMPVLLLAWAGYANYREQNSTEAFCDAVPLTVEIDVEKFEEGVLRHQPSGISGYEEGGGPRFPKSDPLGAHYRPITPAGIKASGMDEFLRSAGAAGKSARISASFYGLFPHVISVCEITLENRRFAAKQVVDGDNSDAAGRPLVIKAYPGEK